MSKPRFPQFYLVATVMTDRDPYRGEFASAEIVPGAELLEYVVRLLAGHGGADAKMQEEAASDEWRLGRWRGEPMRLCGYLTRYDIYPIHYLTLEPPPRDADGAPYDPPLHRCTAAAPDERTWNHLAANYEADLRYQNARKLLAEIGWPKGSESYKAIRELLAKHEPYEAERMRALAGELSAMVADGRLEPDEDVWVTVLRLYRNGYTAGSLRAEVAANSQ